MDEIITCKQYCKELPEEVWEEAFPLVDDAAFYASHEFTTEYVREAVLRGDQQLWLVRAGADTKFVWITEINQQVDRKIVVVYAAAGEMKYGWEFWPYMSQWMVGNAIDEAEVYCRPAMARLLRQHGLRARFEVLTILPFGGRK